MGNAQRVEDAYGVGEMPHAEDEQGSGEHVVVVPARGTEAETAQALLEAAEKVGADLRSVAWSDGNYHVPQEVADAAKLPEGDSTYTVSDDGAEGTVGADASRTEGVDTEGGGADSGSLDPSGTGTVDKDGASERDRQPRERAAAKAGATRDATTQRAQRRSASPRKATSRSKSKTAE